MKKKIAKKKISKERAITGKMSFAEVMQKHPEAAEILFQKGMQCVGCPMAMQESLEAGAMAHGINPKKLVEEINKKIKKKKK